MKIKNFTKFQHFKNRKPPWIKLYRDLLDDKKWHDLDAESSKLLVMLWLLASENTDGELPDTEELAFRLRINKNTLIQRLKKLDHWVLQDDITMISTRYQNDTPETERETEKEREKETDFFIFWKEYPNKKAKPKALEAWRKNKPNLQEVLKALAWQKETEQWQKNGGEFIPYPATWLNAGRWQDEPPEKINGTAKPKEPDWRESKEGIVRVGKEIELEQLPNEDIKSYRKRIQEKLDEIRTH